MKNDMKTPPLRLCVHGSRESHYQQVANERQSRTLAHVPAMKAKAEAAK